MAGLFTVTSRATGVTVDVLDVRTNFVKGKTEAQFLVQNAETGEFEFRLAKLYDTENQDSYTPGLANVATLEELKEAISNGVANINLIADINTPETVTFSRSTFFNGNNHTITFTDIKDGIVVTSDNVTLDNIKVVMQGNDPDWEGHYGIQAYNAKNITFSNIECHGEDGGILINGSIVTINETIDLSGNQFGGIEVSRGTNATRDPILRFGTSLHLVNTTEAYGFPTIWVDGAGSVSGSYALHRIMKDGQQQFYLDEDNTKEPQEVAVTGVTVSPTTATIDVGATRSLAANIAPSDAANKNVIWSTSNATIATVSNTGVVTGVASGSATITATTEDGGFTAASTITVQAVVIPITGLTVAPANTSFNVGSTTNSVATLQPANTTQTGVTWTVEDESIATIAPNGTRCVITGVAEGTTVVRATSTTNSSYTGTTNVTINATTEIG